MASYKIHLLSAVLCCLAVLGQTGEVITLKEVTPPIKVPVAEDATSNADVTVDNHNSSTTTTTTTTITPNTTTTTTTTTTPAPTTPKPPGPPELGTWKYTNSTTNVTCIVIQFAAKLHVTYNMALGNETQYGNVTLNVPTDAEVVGGACDTLDQWVNISWPNDTKAYTIGLHFHKNESQGLYYMHHLNVSIVTDADTFPNASSRLLEFTHASEEWGVATSASYRCVGGAQLSLTESNGAAGTLALTRLQEQAFREGHDTAFSSARDCGGGDVPDAVPIAVGCALGGLVVVVLIAYLVGRRRSAARGYLSM